jgi:hypothetical protein
MKTSQTQFPQNYVSLIQSGKIRIDHVTAAIEGELLSLGGHSVIEGGEIWTIPYQGEEQLARLLDQLNRMGVLLAGGSAGWPPSAIFEDLRQKGLLHGSFKEVASTGPGKWFTRVR